MNDVAVHEIWRRLEALEGQVTQLAGKMLFLEGRIRARLKEQAEFYEKFGTGGKYETQV